MIAGLFIKRIISYYQNIDINTIYTVLVAPCYDKKIEVLKDKSKIQPINLVCTTTELYD